MSGFIQFALDGVALGGIVAILSLAFAISYWPSREVHFGMAAVICATYAYQEGDNQFGFIGGVLIALVVGVLVGLICKGIVYRSISSQFGIFLAGFAVLTIAENVLQLVFGANPVVVNYPAAWLGRPIAIGGTYIDGLQIIEFGAFLLVWAGVELFMRRTNVGVQLLAIADNQYLGRCTGIRTDRRLRQAYVLGSVVAAVGAILFAIDQGGVTTTFGEVPLLFAVNGVLIGGTLSMSGAAVGGWILGFVMDVGVWKLPTVWQTAIAMGVLVLVVLVKPSGLFGRPETALGS